jgi:hypothetical protein
VVHTDRGWLLFIQVVLAGDGYIGVTQRPTRRVDSQLGADLAPILLAQRLQWGIATDSVTTQPLFSGAKIRLQR